MDQPTCEEVTMMNARLYETVRGEPWFAEERARLCALHLQRFSAACSQLHRDTEEHRAAVKDLVATVEQYPDHTRELNPLPAGIRARRAQIQATVDAFKIRTMNYLAPREAWMVGVDEVLRANDATLREDALEGDIPALEQCMEQLDKALEALNQKGASNA